MKRNLFAGLVLAPCLLGLVGTASAAVIVITQQSAMAGGVTPGDAPGFPVILSLPGAYRLDSNLTVPANAYGIVATTHYVDIDMNGFRLYGWNAADDTRVAVVGVFSAFGIGKIHDGFISGFKTAGIQLVGNSNQWVIQDMTIQSNEYGINAGSSSYTRILDSSIEANNRSGVICSDHCLIRGNIVSTNGTSGTGTGVICYDFCHIEGNNVSGNSYSGISVWTGMVLGNTIFSNGALGIGGNAGPSDVGFGNNTIIGNNNNGTQVSGVLPIQSNVCRPVAC